MASSNEDESSSDIETDSETEGIVESDIENDTQFILPGPPALSPGNMPIGGFINLQLWATAPSSHDVKTLETLEPPMVVQPMLNPDWFRPELNSQFTTARDRKLQNQRSLSLMAKRKENKVQ